MSVDVHLNLLALKPTCSHSVVHVARETMDRVLRNGIRVVTLHADLEEVL